MDAWGPCETWFFTLGAGCNASFRKKTRFLWYLGISPDRVEVVINYQERLPELLCYRDELSQVWTNLIHNALQAMDNCGVLTVEVRAVNQSLLVSITDSDKGIPPEILPRIFEPFFTTKPVGEASGWGLDIVKKIVEKHSGKIQVTSVMGQRTFIVSIPIAIQLA